MAESPLEHADGPLRVSISCGGQDQPALPLISVTVRHGFNTIPWARMVIADGDMSEQTLPISDGELFTPGSAIVVKAGYGEAEAPIFSGIVVRHGFAISGENDSRLIIECQSPACRMTLGRQTAHHLDQSDSAVLQALIGKAGLHADVASTSIIHPALVQYDCSDWDFMRARADALGLLVNVDGSTVRVQPPEVGAAAALTLSWGEDLMAFSADIDANSQWTDVQTQSWNPETQSMLQSASASSTRLYDQGDLDGSTLARTASPATLSLLSSAPQPKAVLDAWAKAVQVKAALARVRGQMRFQGSALAKPGALVELQGVGARFSGSVLLTAVEHEISNGHWYSQAEFGLDPQWHVQRPDVMAPPHGGLLPAVSGLQIGVVLRAGDDPQGQQRVLVQVPSAQAGSAGLWARVAQFQASQGFGSFFLPEVGDEVVLGYFNNDPGHPVVLGSLYSSSRKPPYELAAGNDTKAIVTRCGHRIEFNDADQRITVSTPGQRQLVLDDSDKSILVQDPSGNRVRLSRDGISIESPKDISINSSGSISLEAVNGIRVSSQADLRLSGLNVDATAQVAVTAKGGASAELSAAGQTTVKGAMVMIN